MYLAATVKFRKLVLLNYLPHINWYIYPRYPQTILSQLWMLICARGCCAEQVENQGTKVLYRVAVHPFVPANTDDFRHSKVHVH